MGGLGLHELKENVSSLLPMLRQSTDIEMLVPSATGLFTFASTRAKIAENFVAMRALRHSDLEDVTQLEPHHHLVIDIAGNWALPTPPPAISEELKPYPLADHDLSEEARTLDLPPSKLLRPMFLTSQREVLEVNTDEAFDQLIQAIFAVGSAKDAERWSGLPQLARARGEFVGHAVALNMLPRPTTQVSDLSVEDKDLLGAVFFWAVP